MNNHDSPTPQALSNCCNAPIEEMYIDHVIDESVGAIAGGHEADCCSKCGEELMCTNDTPTAQETLESFKKYREEGSTPNNFNFDKIMTSYETVLQENIEMKDLLNDCWDQFAIEGGKKEYQYRGKWHGCLSVMEDIFTFLTGKRI